MTFSNFLKQQLFDFVESYKKYFWRTLLTTLIFSIFCFVAIAFLAKYSEFDSSNESKQVSLLSYFFVRYSLNDTYSIVDLAKTIFIFFVSLFSIGLLRLKINENPEKKELSFFSFIKKLQIQDIIYLIFALILCSAIDYGLYYLRNYSETSILHNQFRWWLQSILFLFRIYLPLIIFAITIFKLTSKKSLNLNFKKIIYLFVSLWIFNEFAYEISIFFRGNIFSLILIPSGEEKKYIFESLLGLILIAFYFVGYFSALTNTFNQFDAEKDGQLLTHC